MNRFSNGYHGQRYCSWARTHDDDGDDDDDDDGDGGVAQHGGQCSDKKCTRGLQRKYAVFCLQDFQRKQKNVPSFFNIGLH